jgi:hypothetical protein
MDKLPHAYGGAVRLRLLRNANFYAVCGSCASALLVCRVSGKISTGIAADLDSKELGFTSFCLRSHGLFTNVSLLLTRSAESGFEYCGTIYGVLGVADLVDGAHLTVTLFIHPLVAMRCEARSLLSFTNSLAKIRAFSHTQAWC